MTATLQAPSTAPLPPPADPEADLAEQIAQTEQRLVAREERLYARVDSVGQQARTAVEKRRWMLSAAGLATASLAIYWLVRRPAARPSADEGEPRPRSHWLGSLPWASITVFLWPLLPARWRDKFSPGMATTAVDTAMPLLQKWLARRAR